MAKLTALPHQAIIDGFRDKVDFYQWHPTCDPETRGAGIAVARKWPRSPGHLRAAAVMAQWPAFTYAAQTWSTLSDEVQAEFRRMASGTGLSGRDLYTRAYLKGLYRYPY